MSLFFYYLKKQNWLTASIIGLLTTLTKNVGIFLLPIYLIALYLSLDYIKFSFWNKLKQLLRKKEFWYSIIIPLGLITYCIYSYYKVGDFLAFINEQKSWSNSHVFMWPHKTLANFFKVIFIDGVKGAGLYTFIRMILVVLYYYLLLLYIG